MRLVKRGVVARSVYSDLASVYSTRRQIPCRIDLSQRFPGQSCRDDSFLPCTSWYWLLRTTTFTIILLQVNMDQLTTSSSSSSSSSYTMHLSHSIPPSLCPPPSVCWDVHWYIDYCSRWTGVSTSRARDLACLDEARCSFKFIPLKKRIRFENTPRHIPTSFIFGRSRQGSQKSMKRPKWTFFDLVTLTFDLWPLLTNLTYISFHLTCIPKFKSVRLSFRPWEW